VCSLVEDGFEHIKGTASSVFFFSAHTVAFGIGDHMYIFVYGDLHELLVVQIGYDLGGAALSGWLRSWGCRSKKIQDKTHYLGCLGIVIFAVVVNRLCLCGPMGSTGHRRSYVYCCISMHSLVNVISHEDV
jgi:hypothetical protein